MTPLEKTLKRSLNIKGIDYVVTLSPGSIKLTLKGRRLGVELKWPDLISGESALAVAFAGICAPIEFWRDKENSGTANRHDC